MSDLDALRVIELVEEAGHKLSTFGDKIEVVPPDIPRPLIDQILAHKRELLIELRKREFLARRPDNLEALQAFCPALWQVAKLRNGQSCVIWGVTANGIIVLPESPPYLMTVDPAEIHLGSF